MNPLQEAEVRAQIDRICDCDAFRATPKIVRLLRFLAEKTLEGGEEPLGQRQISRHVYGDERAPDASGGVVIRMQAGRLRRQLESYYEGPGRCDSVRVELPKRNYRLRFSLNDATSHRRSPRALDRITLAVAEFHDAGRGASPLPANIALELVTCLGPFQALAVLGPVSSADIARAGDFGSDFILHGDVAEQTSAACLTLRLLCRRSGLQIWTTRLALPFTAAGTLDQAGLRALMTTVDELADETGVIACERMAAEATAEFDSLSVSGAALAWWRYLMTGAPDDLLRTRRVAEAVTGSAPNSPTGIMVDAMSRLAVYVSDPRPRIRCPQEPLAMLEQVASRTPGDPWARLNLAFARWITREPLGVQGICRSLDSGPGSGSFKGVLGSLMVVSMIDPGRGEQLLQEALARAPQPLYWFCHHVALAAFQRGDLQAMEAALARIAVRTDPFSLVLRIVAATMGGNRAGAARLARSLLELMPGFPDGGEAMMRRLLHDDHVDAIAAALAPLKLGWFA